MPYYNYGCTHCNYTFELKLPMTDYNLPETAPCPSCKQTGCVAQIIGAPAIGDPIRLGINRPNSGWGDVLSKVKAAHPKGNWSNQKFSPIAGR
jgi:putative FmdB family regulatory protein